MLRVNFSSRSADLASGSRTVASNLGNRMPARRCVTMSSGWRA